MDVLTSTSQFLDISVSAGLTVVINACSSSSECGVTLKKIGGLAHCLCCVQCHQSSCHSWLQCKICRIFSQLGPTTMDISSLREGCSSVKRSLMSMVTLALHA